MWFGRGEYREGRLEVEGRGEGRVGGSMIAVFYVVMSSVPGAQMLYCFKSVSAMRYFRFYFVFVNQFVIPDSYD